jgi:hypothetical protein
MQDPQAVPLRHASRATSPASGRGKESTFLARLRERWIARQRETERENFTPPVASPALSLDPPHARSIPPDDQSSSRMCPHQPWPIAIR